VASKNKALVLHGVLVPQLSSLAVERARAICVSPIPYTITPPVLTYSAPPTDSADSATQS
jgi:hypothetical protein